MEQAFARFPALFLHLVFEILFYKGIIVIFAFANARKPHAAMRGTFRRIGNPAAAVQDTFRKVGNPAAAVQDTFRKVGNLAAVVQATFRKVGNNETKKRQQATSG